MYKKQFHEPKSSLVFLFIALVIFSLAVIFTGHYERLTGDATLYLSIAEKYAAGDFKNAVNGYWGPLTAWLLVPFMYFGAGHVFAINALNLVIGIFTLAGIWKLSYRFEMSENIRGILFIPLVPVILFISMIEPMDFLLLCILVYYLSVVFSADYPQKLSNGMSGGVLGAFAYFAKPYAFPFFITHFTLINALHYIRSRSGYSRRKALKNLFAGFLMFSLLSGIWIGLISSKYNRLTFSNQGRGVFASLGPESEHDTLEKGDPIFYKGFFKPPNETAHVIYEDPTYARERVWNPLDSWDLFSHFAGNVSKNIKTSVNIYESFSRLSIPIVIAYFLFLFNRPISKTVVRYEILYPLMTMILYTGGYFPFHFETRYLWIINILLLLMGAHVLHVFFQKEFFRSNMKKGIMVFFFIVSFAVTPLKSYIQIHIHDINRDMYELGTLLNEKYDIHGNIASNRQKKCIDIHDSWHKTFRLSYWLDSRYYGQTGVDIADTELEGELKKYDIDYFFYWEDSGNIPGFLSGYRELTGGDIPGLRIYSLNEPES